ncbi:MAG: F0F1 ATP synthase subunit delta [Wenzhouxiangellaceae bacterium]|nr:F0F1 ATP synthase subunit delta [Wenzhouxiangellaceae bacterium]
MLSETTLARPYARAAFELADRAGSIDAWSRALSVAAQAVASDAMRGIIEHPRVSEDQLMAVFADVLGDSLDAPFRSFLKVLMHYRRLALMPEIASQFEMLCRRRDQRLKVNVTSAVEMQPEQVEKLSQRLRERFGSEIEMETEVDQDLIGGIIVRAGDRVIDASVRGRLEQLGRQLAR